MGGGPDLWSVICGSRNRSAVKEYHALMVRETDPFPRRVNLGCGFKKLPGYLNVDLNAFHEPDLVADASRLEALPDEYFEHVLAEDVLEHIPRLRTRNVLKEWNRILALGGVLELQVPDVIGLARLLEAKRKSPREQEHLLKCLFGTQAYEGDFHYTGFTDTLLRALLAETGFSVDSLISRDRWLLRARARKVAHSPIDELYRLDGEMFVSAAYRELLGREPDPDGGRFYLAALERGLMREAIVESLKCSDEYRERARTLRS